MATLANAMPTKKPTTRDLEMRLRRRIGSLRRNLRENAAPTTFRLDGHPRVAASVFQLAGSVKTDG
jgi:hypothetical protein